MAAGIGRRPASRFAGRVGKASTKCDQCGFHVNRVKMITITEAGETRVFCGRDCLCKFLEVPEMVIDKVESEVRREVNELHKQVCPRCKHRLLRWV